MLFFSHYIKKKSKTTVFLSLFYILLFCLLQFHCTYGMVVCNSYNSIYIYIYVYIHKKMSYTYTFVSSYSQCFPRIMEAPLTKNVISYLLSGSVHLQPLLQVFSLQPFRPTNATTPRFRITISDGNNTHQTLLPTTFNSLISNGELQEGFVIKLSKCTCTIIHNNT